MVCATTRGSRRVGIFTLTVHATDDALIVIERLRQKFKYAAAEDVLDRIFREYVKSLGFAMPSVDVRVIASSVDEEASRTPRQRGTFTIYLPEYPEDPWYPKLTSACEHGDIGGVTSTCLAWAAETYL